MVVVMDKAFDIRKESDRLALVDLLPTIDNTLFTISRNDFLNALANVAIFLNNPSWLVYQWGSFVPFDAGPAKLVLSLKEIVDLGMQLSCLSKYHNFDRLLAGFSNPPQFEDTLFEVKVAYFFASLPTVTEIRFEPEYNVRGHFKHPEFAIEGRDGRICVECKRPHMFVQEAIRRLHRIRDAFHSAMVKQNWPSDLRLEVEIKGRLYGRVVELISTAVEEAIKSRDIPGPIIIGPFQLYVVRRSNHFHIKSAPWHTDTMILEKGIATGLLNPEFTALRVADYSMDSRFERSVGSRINEALKQLPKTEKCMIFIGQVSPRIAVPICQKRLGDSVYTHIIAFGIWMIDDPYPSLIYRQPDSKFIKEFFDSVGSVAQNN